jgi:hypothetical protein
MAMSAPSDAEVIGRSLSEPEAFGLIYDRHAATRPRVLGRRAGARVAEGLVGELFRIAFERRKTFVFCSCRWSCGRGGPESRSRASQRGTNRCFAIIPWTPWRWSTTWVTPKSPATETSE